MGKIYYIILPSVILGLWFVAGSVFPFDVALVPVEGEAAPEKLEEVENALVSSLKRGAHHIYGPDETSKAMKRLAIDRVESLKDAELIASKLGVEFVVLSHVVPMAGQDSVEIKAYYLPEGRVELLEEVAAEGELEMVIEGMLMRLITTEGISGRGISEEEEEMVSEREQKREVEKKPSGASAPEEFAPLKHEKPQGEEKLVDDLRPWPQKKTRMRFGSDYRIALEVHLAPTVMLTSPVNPGGGRIGGCVSLGVGYVASPACGCEFGGEIRTFFGTGDGFSISPYAGFNFGLHSSFPIFAGGRISIGFFKGISGARRNQMVVRGAFNLTMVFVGRYMVLLTPASTALLVFDGKPVVFYEAGAGFGVRF